MSFQFVASRGRDSFNPQPSTPIYRNGESIQQTGKAERLSMKRDSLKNRYGINLDNFKMPRSAQGSLAADKKLRSSGNWSMADEPAQYCPSHPLKKAKYFLQSNLSIGCCTKCAVTMSYRYNLIEEDQLRKMNELYRFKSRLYAIRLKIMEKYQDLGTSFQQIDYAYRQDLQDLTLGFYSIFKALSNHYDRYVEQLEKYYAAIKTHFSIKQQELSCSLTTIQSYNNDISRNYNDILSDLTMDKFKYIMEEYSRKLVEQQSSTYFVLPLKNKQKYGIYFIDRIIKCINGPPIERVSLKCRPDSNKENNQNASNCYSIRRNKHFR